MPDRVILHSDLNNFYASAECILFPEFKNQPLAVCGDEKARHGIVLAKSEEAKKYGVRTGDVIWEAKRKCPHLVIRPARFSVYTKLSKEVRDIYGRFTDHIEPFGIDECWLDVTKSGVFGSGYEIAEQIRRAVREELGLSVSVGVSFNKVFAKLASDLKKPDAVSVVDRSNFRDKIYGLPVTDLLFVGKSMAARLEKIGVRTIGALAAAEPAFLQSYLGKWGQTLSTYARGEDDSPVRHIEEAQELKSIGNSTTWREDILNLSDVKRVLYILSESVASRLKDAGLGKANTVHLWVRDRDLNDYSYQKKVRPTALCGEIAQEAYALFCEHYALRRAVRGLGVTVSGFDKGVEQLTFGFLSGDYEKKARAEQAVEKIRSKYGYEKLQRGIMFEDKASLTMDLKGGRLMRPKKGEIISDEGKDK